MSTMTLITLCTMVVVRRCVSVAEEVESYMARKSGFGPCGQNPLA